MREKLQNLPWWAWSLIEGVFFGTGMTVFSHWQRPMSWTAAIVGGVISGVLFGAVMGPLVVRLRRGVSTAAGNLSKRDLREAGRASTRGPVPSDPDIRQAASRLATHQLDEFSRFSRLGLILFVPLTVLSAFLALTDSPSWWAAVTFSAAFVAFYFVWPRHLHRRIEILSHGTTFSSVRDQAPPG